MDRLIGRERGMGKRAVREVLASGVVCVGGAVERDGSREVGRFVRVEVGEEVLQARVGRYVLVNKPVGVVSATVDDEHATVVGLVDREWAGELHLAGRLDRSTSGLVVLTNDSEFSERLTRPEEKVGKVYLVETDSDIPGEAVEAFEVGMWFAKEGVRTQPARVEMLGAKRCRLTIYEGKHHQVKRMFLRFGVRVVGLHREAVGELVLAGLRVGGWRELTAKEVGGLIDGAG